MRHVLFTPSSKDKYPKLPLIILLHGSGEVAKDKQRFLWSSFYYIMNNWNTEGFNAYVVYPQLYGNFYDNVWCSKTSKNNLKNLIEHLIATEKIDPQRIVIAGSSLGAQGAQYMAHEMPEYISAQVVISGYHPQVDMSEVTMPTIAYIGTKEKGEAQGSINYTYGYFKSVFGNEKIIELPTSHGALPEVVFALDENGDNRSDIIEWMLSQKRNYQ